MAIETLASLAGPLGTVPGLEIGQVSQPWNVPVAAPRTAQDLLTADIGATGTAIFSGFARELGEYDSSWIWPNAYWTCEHMRRSDAQVAATLWASKLPIRGGEWKVQPPDKPNAIEQEATDFVQQEMFDGDNDFDAMIENALLMFDFGSSLHEDVYRIDGNRIRLKKTAPRLPLTFFRWLCDAGTDDLRVIEQLGYRAGQYVRRDLPIEKCCLFTFRQEGANFTGRSLLREMYQHWYIKQGLYTVEAITCERNGLGVPVVTMGPDAKTEDRKSALEWVTSLTAHERTGLVLPPGWTFALEGVKGTTRDPKDAIQHHGTLITVVGLAQFMMMGQSGHGAGNRSLGETMGDFFFMGLQASADLIAHRISQTTVRRLVAYNFGDRVKSERCPQVTPQRIMALKFDAIVDALAKLGQGNILTPTPELEAWIRREMGAPESDKATIVRERAKRTVSLPGQPAGTNSSELTPNDEAGAADLGRSAAAGQTKQRQPAGSKGSAGTVAGSEKTMRAPRGFEKCLAASEIVGALDKGRDDVAAALRAARPRVQAEIVHKVMNRPVGQMHRASVAPDEKLQAEVAGILGGLRDFGQEQIGKERARQLAGKPAPDAAQVRLAGADKSKDPVGLYADGVVSEFTNTLSARATNAAIDRKRKGGTDGEIIQAVNADLADQSDKWIDGVAGKGANEAFAAGRLDGFDAYADEIDRYIYSAMLDINCCGNCAAADGAEGQQDDLPAVPNEDCDGGDRCRCVLVAVFADEGSKT
jgi:phage gp29-like protein